MKTTVRNWNYPVGFGDDEFEKRMAEVMDRLKRPEQPQETPIRKLGVLLVHGIGDQRRGNTLTRFGEPLFSCARRLLQHRSGGADLERVELKESVGERPAPSHARVRLWHERQPEPKRTGIFAQTAQRIRAISEMQEALSRLEPAEIEELLSEKPAPGTDNGPQSTAVGTGPESKGIEDVPTEDGNPEIPVAEPPTERDPEPDGPGEPGETDEGPKRRYAEWIIAESNWAAVFERPSFWSVAFWSVTVVPWLISTQFVDQLRAALRERRIARGMFSIGYLVLTFPLALLIQLLVLLLVPMALFPPLRPVVAPIQRWVSGVIGDSFVLLTSKFQFQSMVTKVRDDIDWLVNVEKCDVVAVLAHSQGAAVAHEAVQQAKEPKVERLITFGSAVARLKALGFVMDHARPMLTASTLVTLAVGLLAGLYVWNLVQFGGSFLIGFWGLTVLLAVVSYLMPFTLKGINELCHRDQNFKLSEHTEWDDYFASADPVSNGEMLVSRLYTNASVEVHNGANTMSDHSTYWKNLDEFGSRIACSMLRLTGGPFKSAAWQPDSRRESRTRYRVAARVTALAAVALALFEHPWVPEYLHVGKLLQVPLALAATLLNWLVSLASDAVQLVGSALNLIEGGLTPPLIPEQIERLSWPMLCVFAALAWYVVSLGILKWWEGSDTEDHYRSRSTWRSARPKKTWWGWLAVLAVPWLAFWVTWIAADPGELASQLKDKSESAPESFWIWVLFAVQQLFLSRWDRRGGDVDLPTGLGDVLEDLWDGLVDKTSALFEWLGTPRVMANLAGFGSLVTALTSVAVVLFQPATPAAFQLALALGLLTLALGVRAWVPAEGKLAWLLAATGIFVGVALIPVAIAFVGDFSPQERTTLIAAGVLSLSLGYGGAHSLKAGWAGIQEARSASDA